MVSLPGWTSSLLAAGGKYQVQLVWGTDEPKAASADMKVLAPETRDRLRQLRWKNYFVVKSEAAAVSSKEATKVTLSDRCAVELKELPNGDLEVRMHSIKAGTDAKQVASRTMPIKDLQQGNLIIYAGDSKDRWDDAWLVIVGVEKPAPAK
jgi:hypothetical protein